MNNQTLRDFHESYVKGIKPGELVIPEMHLLTLLTNEVVNVLGPNVSKVHIRSIVLKHIYEKRNAYEYDIILDHLAAIVKYPDHIYLNSDLKQANFLFVKEIEGAPYACALKLDAHPEAGQEITVVVSAFKTTPRYLRKFELIESWKGGNPSS